MTAWLYGENAALGAENGTARTKFNREGSGLEGNGYTKECGSEAMGIDWMTVRELSQAIPPAYTEWIGRQVIHVFSSGCEKD